MYSCVCHPFPFIVQRSRLRRRLANGGSRPLEPFCRRYVHSPICNYMSHTSMHMYIYIVFVLWSQFSISSKRSWKLITSDFLGTARIFTHLPSYAIHAPIYVYLRLPSLSIYRSTLQTAPSFYGWEKPIIRAHLETVRMELPIYKHAVYMYMYISCNVLWLRLSNSSQSFRLCRRSANGRS